MCPKEPDWDPALEKKVKELQERGWGEAKINRWLAEKQHVAAREERVFHQLFPWRDDESTERANRFLDRCRKRAWVTSPYGDPFFDRQTALDIVNEAESGGLIVRPGEFVLIEPDGYNPLLPDHHGPWEKLTERSYQSGGREGAVAASAQAFRELIATGFPYDADLVSFDLY